jgi:hypothetical protein
VPEVLEALMIPAGRNFLLPAEALHYFGLIFTPFVFCVIIHNVTGLKPKERTLIQSKVRVSLFQLELIAPAFADSRGLQETRPQEQTDA